MKRMSLCMLLACVIQLSQCDILSIPEASQITTAGFLVTESDASTKIFIQDIEDGSVIELKFFNDNARDLDFDEFSYVEVKGLFAKRKNTLYVEELHPTIHECKPAIVYASNPY